MCVFGALERFSGWKWKLRSQAIVEEERSEEEEDALFFDNDWRGDKRLRQQIHSRLEIRNGEIKKMFALRCF